MRKYLYLAATLFLFQNSTVDASSCVIPLVCDGVPTWRSHSINRTNNSCMKSLSNDIRKFYQKEMDKLEGDVHAVETDLEELKDKFESFKRIKTDVDECATSGNDCHTKSTCTNTIGSCTCDNGYTGNGKTCLDIDECATGDNDCHERSTCVNTPGSYNCMCGTGFTGDGKECLDIDECATDNKLCHEQATCLNEPASYTCVCNEGFTQDGKNCSDLDECATGFNDCHQQSSCVNTPGSYSCICSVGYDGDGKKCSVSCISDPVNNILYNGTCYWIRLPAGSTSVNLEEAENLCTDSGGTLANIYSREHYDMIVKKIRTSEEMNVYTGMKYDKQNKTLLNSDGTAAKFQLWRYGDPRTSFGGGAVLPVCIEVLPNPRSIENGMLTSNKGWPKRGAVCMG